MKIMITGSKGQVGSCLARQLSGKVDLLAVDHNELDITNQDAVLETVTKFGPDYIINAAAYTAVDKAEEEVKTSYAINCDGPRYLAEAAHTCGAVLLHISTDYVFNGEGTGAYKESSTTGPQGVYGKSKLAGELAVAAACEKHLILRTAWVFGEKGNNFVKTMLRLAEQCDALNIVGDQFGGPTYAGDIAAALIKMVEVASESNESIWGTYHFSGLPHVSWYEFARAIFDAAERDGVLQAKPNLSPISTSEYPTPAKRPANSRMDCSKIQQRFNIQPSNWQHALHNISAYK